jgi:kynurenine formamidase
MPSRAPLLICAGFLLAISLPARSLDVQGYRLIDLTHSYNANTVYWPSGPAHFSLERLHFGDTEGGFFYSANAFCTPEHGGTHLDAPIHFARGRETAERVPLERLIGPAVVIDVSDKAAADRDYRVTAADVLAFEARYGPIVPGTPVLVHTGWSRRWPDATAYLGHATDATRLHFPSYGEDAARLLVEERQVALLGIDTASIDFGPATDFPVHRIAAAASVPGLENITGLEALPPRGALLVALPMKIEGGSGGPTRVIALVPRDAVAATDSARSAVDRLVADYIGLYTGPTLERWTSLFHPAVVVASPGEDGTIRTRTLAEFVARQKDHFATGRKVSERLENIRVDMGWRIARVSADFVFLDEGQERPGKLGLHLAEDEGGWKIMALLFSYNAE